MHASYRTRGKIMSPADLFDVFTECNSALSTTFYDR